MGQWLGKMNDPRKRTTSLGEHVVNFHIKLPSGTGRGVCLAGCLRIAALQHRMDEASQQSCFAPAASREHGLGFSETLRAETRRVPRTAKRKPTEVRRSSCDLSARTCVRVQRRRSCAFVNRRPVSRAD
jgi:hypothetical protein